MRPDPLCLLLFPLFIAAYDPDRSPESTRRIPSLGSRSQGRMWLNLYRRLECNSEAPNRQLSGITRGSVPQLVANMSMVGGTISPPVFLCIVPQLLPPHIKRGYRNSVPLVEFGDCLVQTLKPPHRRSPESPQLHALQSTHRTGLLGQDFETRDRPP